MTALDCGFLSVRSQLDHIYRDLVKPAESFGDDEQKPMKLAAIVDCKLYEELNEKLAECVSRALKGILSLKISVECKHKHVNTVNNVND